MPTTKLDETTDVVELFAYLHGDWIVPPQFLRWAALSLVAACVEDRVYLTVLDHAPLYPNIWVFLIGPSGSGKDVAIGSVMQLLHEDDSLWVVDGRVTMPALYDYMYRRQQQTGRASAPVYLVSSDITEQLPVGLEAKDFTSRAFGLYGGRERSLNDLTRTSGEKVIRRPLLNWLAGTTKEWFPLAIEPVVYHSGFAGRACFILGEQIVENFHMRAPTRRVDHDRVLAFIRSRIEALQRVEGVIVMNDKARRTFDQWLLMQQERLQQTQLSDTERAVYNRLRMTVLKLSMLFALSSWDPRRLLIIKSVHVLRALRAADTILQGVLAVGEFAYTTTDTALLDKVVELIRRRGVISRRDLMREARKRGVPTAKRLQEILDTLEQAGEIRCFRERTSPGGPWIRKVRYLPRKIFLPDGEVIPLPADPPLGPTLAPPNDPPPDGDDGGPHEWN